MTLHEPATMLTDYLLALVGLVLGLMLRRGIAPAPRNWFSWALLLSALSAFVGGSYHGLAPNFSAEIGAAWWRLTLLTLSGVSAALAFSLMHEVTPPRHQTWVRWIILVKLGVFAAIAVVKPVFVVAIADYGTALIAWLVAAVALRRKWSRWMLAAIALSVIAAVVQQLRLAPSHSFNHNDLYHVIQGFALGAFYRGARLLGGREV